MIGTADHVAIVGVGGNLGGDDALLARFAAAARGLCRYGVVQTASVYRTAAIGGPAQPDYLNSAIRIDLADPPATPLALLAALLALETQLGRVRPAPRWSARTIDLDLLLVGDQVVELTGPPALVLPHPRLLLRRFALLPVIELVGPDVRAPGTSSTLGQALAGLDPDAQPVAATPLRVDVDARPSGRSRG